MPPIQRVKDILLKPKDTWPAIAQEGGDTASMYRGYLVYLAAIPAVAGFIGMSLVGAGAFGFSVRVPVLAGLAQMVVGYVLSLVAVFVLALIADALAPTFGGSRSRINALKLVAYGSTAGFLGGIFSLLPGLAVLGILAGLYSIYLLYTGLPVLMKCPPEKAAAYTAVLVICGLVALIVLTVVSSLFMPSPAYMGGMPGSGGNGGDVTFKTPGGQITIDTAKMEEMARQMEKAGKRMEQAQASGGTPIAAQDLKALLPEALGDLRRESYEVQGGQTLGVAGSSARASYAAGERRVQLSITDMGGMAGLAALAGWAGMTVDRETDTQVEKVYKQGERTVREEYRKDGSRAELTVILDNGVVVEAKGQRVELAELQRVIAGVDLGRIEAMKRAAK